jgi:plastocyanin
MRHRLRPLLALGTALVAVPGLAACGGDHEAGHASGETPAVSLVDFAFEPADVTVSPGDTVTFSNAGEQLHNVRGPGFFSDGLASGARYAHRFTKPGRYPYLCTLHPQSMRGVITVEPN